MFLGNLDHPNLYNGNVRQLLSYIIKPTIFSRKSKKENILIPRIPHDSDSFNLWIQMTSFPSETQLCYVHQQSHNSNFSRSLASVWHVLPLLAVLTWNLKVAFSSRQPVGEALILCAQKTSQPKSQHHLFRFVYQNVFSNRDLSM